MADVAPFRAIRYARPDARRSRLRPTTCSTPEARDAYRARDPHNVVHLTLNDSEEEAGPAVPGLARRGSAHAGRRAGRVGAEPGLRRPGRDRARVATGSSPRCASSPTRRGAVLPHERTHAGPKESRLRLLRAARAQLEPIFLLYDGEPAVAVPDREPDLAAEGTRLWRVAG